MVKYRRSIGMDMFMNSTFSSELNTAADSAHGTAINRTLFDELSVYI